FRTMVTYNTDLGPIFTRVADLNNDGKLDLAVADFNPTANDISVFLGNGDGTFQPAVNYPTKSFSTISILAVDFDGDGKLELAGDISVFRGNGDGTFQSALKYPAGAHPRSLAAADFNQDGKLDLAVASEGSNDVSILFGKNDGTFKPPARYTAGYAPRYLAV